MSKIIDTNERPRGEGARFGKLLILGVIILVVAAAGIGWFLLQKQVADDNKPKPLGVDIINQEAAKIATAQSFAEASKYYDEQISLTDDRDRKVELLMGKAATAANVGDSDAALKAAQDANTVSSDAGTLHMIGQAYEQKGDTAKALEYYKKALAVLPESEVTNRLEISLQMKIEALSQ